MCISGNGRGFKLDIAARGANFKAFRAEFAQFRVAARRIQRSLRAANVFDGHISACAGKRQRFDIQMIEIHIAARRAHAQRFYGIRQTNRQPAIAESISNSEKRPSDFLRM